jgi:hypothetical protein
MTNREVQPAPLRGYEEIAQELERVADLLLHDPKLNHRSAERLMEIVRDIRADAARVR